MKENGCGRNVHGPAVATPPTRRLPHLRQPDREVLVLGWMALGDTVTCSAEAHPVNATCVRPSHAGMGEIAISPRPRP